MMYYEEAFRVLEIAPTTDKKIIKKAYAALVRKYHPEEHPQKWKEVHDAYKVAMNYVDNKRGENVFDISSEQAFSTKGYEQTEKAEDIASIGIERQEMARLFENIEELSEESKAKALEENKAQLALAMRELDVLRGKRKQTVEDWQKIFFNENYSWAIEQDTFLMDVGRAVEGTAVSKELYLYLKQQLNYIKQSRQNVQDKTLQRGIISGISYAEMKVESAYVGGMEEKNRVSKNIFIGMVFAVNIILFILAKVKACA